MTPAAAVTIIMPVYNGEAHLSSAVGSILAQTFTDLTLLIIDDGSTDRTAEIIESFSDPRITVIRNPHNLGLARSLNIAISQVKSPYIARMDCDDISCPKRLEIQIQYMEVHPDIGLCGSYYSAFEAEGGDETVRRPPLNHGDILYELLFDNAFGHSTVVFRTDLINRFDLKYDESLKAAQDYDLWVRMTPHCKVANLPITLVRYRCHNDSVSVRHADEQRRIARRVSEFHRTQLGLLPKSDDTEIHQELMSMNFPESLDKLRRAGDWLSRLLPVALFRCRQPLLSTLFNFNKLWYSACGRNAASGIIVFIIYIFKPYGFFGNPLYSTKLLYRCLSKSPITSN